MVRGVEQAVQGRDFEALERVHSARAVDGVEGKTKEEKEKRKIESDGRRRPPLKSRRSPSRPLLFLFGI